MRLEFNISCGGGGGPRRPCGFTSAGSSHYKMWVGLNGFDPRTDLVLGSERIGMGCMNLVTVISRYARVPVTLKSPGRSLLTTAMWASTECFHLPPCGVPIARPDSQYVAFV